MIRPDVVLYTKDDCPLCDEAHDVLVRHGLRPRIVSIGSAPDLHERYCQCVPVVAINGKLRFRGRVNTLLLRRLLMKEGWETP